MALPVILLYGGRENRILQQGDHEFLEPVAGVAEVPGGAIEDSAVVASLTAAGGVAEKLLDHAFLALRVGLQDFAQFAG